ncbi:hypothetical protein VST7929_01841 [Vibrio stylophorae]|uniref:Formate transporter FocA n=1 Tax=Vibrio stylophorae TaxID=659351 RepID=A0ABN8DUJ9_9VIBR|nr:formate transporter FocA [Vibrio stylophorae]CAH0533959.1 hypothetical protein VST7929_01841 [Vibrio stylophorae]
MAEASSGTMKEFSPAEMMKQAEKYAKYKASKPTSTTISLAMTAGVFIGLAFVFYLTVTTGNSGSWGLTRVAGGLAFSLGLIFVVICGGELFTSTVLSSIARANRQITTGKMFSTWAKVYFGNFLGAMLLLGLVTMGGLYQLDHGQWGLNALNVAQHKLHHTWSQAFALGILCNLLVCLAVWMTFCSDNMLTKSFLMMMPVALFVSTGFEHSVANMFMVPFGITIAHNAPDAFWTGVGVAQSQYSDLNISNFIFHNLIPVTLGNIVGGAVLVGLSYWNIFTRPHLADKEVGATLTSVFDTAPRSNKEMLMNQDKLTIRDHMSTAFPSLSPELSIDHALDILLAENVSGAPVVTKDGRLVGFFSEHDALVDLWCSDYMPEAERKVQDLMRRELQTVSPTDSILDLAEYMCIDKNVLYPVSDSGIATSFNTASLPERARNALVNRPHTYPVMEEETIVGVITRHDIVKAMRATYGTQLSVIAHNDEARETA